MMASRRSLAVSIALGALSLAPLFTSALPVHASAQASKHVTQPSMEVQILRLVNVQREKRGCKPLVAQGDLRKAALKHTKKMANAETLSHRLPGEKALGKRVTAAGYKNWRLVGENVAYGYPSAQEVMRAWMKSPGHRSNILNCTYRHLGVGIVVRDDIHWYTQDFGRK